MWNTIWVGSTAVPNCTLLVPVCQAPTNCQYVCAQTLHYLSSHLAEHTSYIRAAILLCKVVPERYITVQTEIITHSHSHTHTHTHKNSVFLVKCDCSGEWRCVTTIVLPVALGIVKQTDFINMLICESVILVKCVDYLIVSNYCTLYIVYCILYIVYCTVSKA